MHVGDEESGASEFSSEGSSSDDDGGWASDLCVGIDASIVVYVCVCVCAYV